MDDFTAKLAEQLKSNPAMLRSLIQSHDGQTLMHLLTKDDHGAKLQNAIHAATQGNPAQMSELITRIMQTPDGAALIQRINNAVQR